MKIIERNGEEVDFCREKLYKSIIAANDEVRKRSHKNAVSENTISIVLTRLYERCRKRPRPTTVDELQDMVEIELMKERAYETAKEYIWQRCLTFINDTAIDETEE